MTHRLALVLTSGGARGAYQAGALRAIADLTQSQYLPFPILSGVSAGSINVAYLASRADDFQTSTKTLAQFWSEIKSNDVFLTDAKTLTRTGMAWLHDLGLGGWTGSGHAQSLLVTHPLKNLLEASIDFKKIHHSIQQGEIRGLAVTATNYCSGTAVTFFDGHNEIQPWIRSTRFAVRTPLAAEHVLASSAIPFFFPAVQIDRTFYGDGCIRMNTPLSPAVHLGADRILAIAVRHERSIDQVSNLNIQTSRYPYLAEIGGILLNAMFLDALDSDIERMERINQTISLLPSNHPSRLRTIPVMALRPSRDLGSMVSEIMNEFSFPIRHLLKGLGVSTEIGWDLLSYLAFDSAYTSQLVKLGYEDTVAQKEKLLEFIR